MQYALMSVLQLLAVYGSQVAGASDDALATTGWTPDDRRRADGTLGPRSSARGFALPKDGTYGWQKWAVENIAARCKAAGGWRLHSDCASRDMYQFGVYTGRSLRGTTRALRQAGVPYNTFWGFDSFQGLPPEDPSARRSAHSKSEWQVGTFNAADMYKVYSFMQLEKRITAYVNDPHVKFVRGYFNESCTPELVAQRDLRPALYVDVDVDLYVSAKQALEYLLRHNLLVPGSVVGYDDWPAGGRRGGEQRAHRELTKAWGLRWRNLVPECKTELQMQCVFELQEVGSKKPDCDCL